MAMTMDLTLAQGSSASLLSTSAYSITSPVTVVDMANLNFQKYKFTIADGIWQRLFAKLYGLFEWQRIQRSFQTLRGMKTTIMRYNYSRVAVGSGFLAFARSLISHFVMLHMP